MRIAGPVDNDAKLMRCLFKALITKKSGSRLADNRFGRHHAVTQVDFPDRRPLLSHLRRCRRDLKARRTPLDQKCCNGFLAARSILGPGEHGEHIGDQRERNVAFRPIQLEAAVAGTCPDRLERGRVEPASGSVNASAAVNSPDARRGR